MAAGFASPTMAAGSGPQVAWAGFPACVRPPFQNVLRSRMSRMSISASARKGRAIYKVMGALLVWALLLAVTIVGMISGFAVKAFGEYFNPSDVQIAGEMEKS